MPTDAVPTGAAVGGGRSTDRVPGNAVALLSGRVAGAVLMVAVVAISAHRLSDTDFGLVVSVLAAGFLANMAVTFGTDTVIVREIASGEAAGLATAWAALRLQLIAAVGFVVVAVVAVATTALPAVVAIQAASLVPLALMTVAGAVLRGREQMVRLLVASVGGAVVTLAATLVGFAVDESTWVPIGAVALGAAVSASVAWAAAGIGLRGPATARVSLRTLVVETVPFAAMVVLTAVGAQGGLLIVELAGDDPAGGYGVAVRLNEAARLVPAAVMGALFPTMIVGSATTARYRWWIRGLGWYAVGATGVLLAGAGIINDVVFDGQPDGAALIRVLALGIGLIVLRLKLSFELIAARRERVVLVAAASGTMVFLTGGLLGVVTAGAIAVAWAQNAGLAVAVAVMFVARR